MKKIISISALVFFMMLAFLQGNAQDLISAGSNSWIFHTPDDGRTSLYIAPGTNGGSWDFTKQIFISNQGNLGVGITQTSVPIAKLSVSANGTELSGTAASSTFRTNAGLLGATNGNRLKLASLGFQSGNHTSLGIEAIRTADGTSWATTAIGLELDVDATSPVNNAAIWMHAGGNVGIGTASPAKKLHVEGSMQTSGWYYLDSNTPTILLQDRNGRSGMIHVNSDQMYFLTASETDKNQWVKNGNYWPLVMNLTDDDLTFGGNAYFLEGNVGIGTATPNTSLTVRTANAAANARSASLANAIGDSRFELAVTRGATGNALGDVTTQIGQAYNGGAITEGIRFMRGGGATDGAMAFVTNNGTERMRILSNGNVGIGISNPAHKIDVLCSDANAGNRLTDGTRWLLQLPGNTGNGSYNGLVSANDNALIFSGGSMGTGNLVIGPHSLAASGIKILGSNGNVGIGTANPQSLLSVNGTITSKVSVVTQTGWADFVFKPGYVLPSLSEVKQYISENGHLPGVPSEKEIEVTGNNLGGTDAILLQKIEELTLYLIEIKEDNQKLKAEIKKLYAALNNTP